MCASPSVYRTHFSEFYQAERFDSKASCQGKKKKPQVQQGEEGSTHNGLVWQRRCRSP